MAVTSRRLGGDAQVQSRLFPKIRSWFALGAPLELRSPLAVLRPLVALVALVWPLTAVMGGRPSSRWWAVRVAVAATVWLLVRTVQRSGAVDPGTGVPTGIGVAQHLAGEGPETPLLVAVCTLSGLSDAREALGHPVANELMRRVDRMTSWAFATVLDAAARWHRAGLVLPVPVNLSARTIGQPDLAAWILDQLADRRLPPEALTIEITETATVDLRQAVHLLRPLHERGARVSIDDFGTGYTSLAALPQLPLDEIKVDTGFARPLDEEKLLTWSGVLRPCRPATEDPGVWPVGLRSGTVSGGRARR